MNLPRYQIRDRVRAFGFNATVVNATTDSGHPNHYIYRVMYDDGSMSRWINQDSLQPIQSRASRIEAAARDVVADYESGFSTHNAIIALKRALEEK